MVLVAGDRSRAIRDVSRSYPAIPNAVSALADRRTRSNDAHWADTRVNCVGAFGIDCANLSSRVGDSVLSIWTTKCGHAKRFPGCAMGEPLSARDGSLFFVGGVLVSRPC